MFDTTFTTCKASDPHGATYREHECEGRYIPGNVLNPITNRPSYTLSEACYHCIYKRIDVPYTKSE